MRSTWKKILFLTTLCAVAIGSGAYLIFGVAPQNSTQNDTDISGNYGSAYGIHDLSTDTDDFIPGLPASTVNFEMGTSDSADPLVALTQVGKTLSRKASTGDPSLININAVNDENNEQGLTFHFYPNSPSDYIDGTYENVVNNTRLLIEDNLLENLTVVSKPTNIGTRTFDVEATIVASGTTASSSMQNVWAGLIDSLGNIPTDGTRNHVILSSADERKMVVEGNYFDEQSLNSLKTLDPRVFTTVTDYIVGASFEPSNIKEARFIAPVNATSNDAQFKLTISGDQPTDGAAVTAWVSNFTANAYNKENILLPWVSTTLAQYENSAEAVYINYPTNMEW